MHKIIAALFFFGCLSAQANMYKCTVDGKTTYQSSPSPDCQPINIIDDGPNPEEMAQIIEKQGKASSSYHGPGYYGGTDLNKKYVQQPANIERSEAAKIDFKYSHPCPSNGNTKGSCPGYVIDHIKALSCSGVDDPANMQWQSVEQGKAKDAWERDGCSVGAAQPYKKRSYSDRDFRQNSESYHGIVTTPSGGESYSGHDITTGPRGGKYYINSNGNKTYIKH